MAALFVGCALSVKSFGFASAPEGGASGAFARLVLYLETVPLLQKKAPPLGELANECEPERVRRAESKQ